MKQDGRRGLGRLLRSGGRWGVALAIGLVVLELLARICGLGGTSVSRGALHAYDPDAGWTCAKSIDVRFARPGAFDVAVRTNESGRRDVERARRKPPGVRRIAVLGDSTMWGYGVENEEVFAARVSASLDGWQTINFGANGYSTVQELIRFERDAVHYEPDWTILAFCGNDLDDNVDDKDGGRPIARLGAEGTVEILNRPVRRRWKAPLKQWLRRHSRLFSAVDYRLGLLRHAYRERKAAERRTARASAPPASSQTTSSQATRRGAAGGETSTQRISHTDLFLPPSRQVAEAWEIERRLLRRLRDSAKRVGSRVVVLYIPSRAEVDSATFDATIRASVSTDLTPGLAPGRIARTLHDIADELGVPFLDLTPAFVRQPKPLDFFIAGDGHWNAAGHQLAAQTFVTWLNLTP